MAAADERVRPAIETPPAGYSYFVDFRSGLDSITGHTYVVYGRIDARGRPHALHNADFFPEDENMGLIVGLLLPVRAGVRVSDGDSAREHVINYRRYLTAGQFAQVIGVVRQERIAARRWNLLLFNCNEFVHDIAQTIGLHTPSTLLLPHAYVAALRVLNGRQN